MDEIVSIVVPCYNVEKYVDACINSLVSQTYANIEIVAVVDGATDNTESILRSHAERDARIKVYTKENGGLSDARNYGIKRATGKYLTFVDSDDMLEPSFVEEMLAQLKKTGSDLVCCPVGILSDETRERTDLAPIDSEERCQDYRLFMKRMYNDLDYKICFICAYAKLCLREKYDEFEFPKGRVCEDAYSILDFIQPMEGICLLPRNLYIYRKREGSITSFAKEKAYICAEIDWRIVHFKHWMERKEYELAGLVGFELLYIIYNNRDTLDRDERKRYFSDYEQCWRFMLKHGKMNLKRKIKFLFFARPKVLLRKERKND